jgi:hypothetical protein
MASKDIRKFGIIAFLFFGILCAVGIWRQKPVPIYLFGFLSCLGLGFILIPVILEPVYRGWLNIAHFIGQMITTLMLAIAYYVVITPAALLKRLFGGRPLPLSPDPDASTYWVSRDEPAQPKERFYKRF